MSTTTNDDDEQPVVDDPCWGGPELHRHDLPFLLRRIEEGAFDGAGAGTDAGDDDKEVSGGSVARRSRIRRRIVLHEDEGYVALNKPPDLRMDGPFPATVHKLLTYWYPSPSLLERASSSAAAAAAAAASASVTASVGDASTVAVKECPSPAKATTAAAPSADAAGTGPEEEDVDHLDGPLLSEVAALAKHNDLPDNALRSTHQLDYATSGVLLVGRTRRSAGRACRAFQDREAVKTYLAVVRGGGNGGGDGGPDAELAAAVRSLPVLEDGALAHWTDGSEERAYRKGRKKEQKGKRKGGTFEGYQPHHAMFQIWKERRQREANKEGGGSSTDPQEPRKKKKKRRNGGAGSGDAASRIMEDALAIAPLQLDEGEMEALTGMKWAEVKKNEKWRAVFQCMSDKFNDALREKVDHTPPSSTGHDGEVDADQTVADGTAHRGERSSAPPQQQLPNLFRLENEPPDAFYIHAPIAEVPGEFRCRVRASDCAANPHGRYCASFCGGGGVGGGGDNGDDGGVRSSIRDPAPNASADAAGAGAGAAAAAVLEYKPSLTRCRILWTGRSDGAAAAKLRLEPRTGRRHQLRLHLAAVAGWPIVGDVAYGGDHEGIRGGEDDPEEEEKEEECDGIRPGRGRRQSRGSSRTRRRMCLHAHSLSIPGTDGVRMEIVAPDPFPVRVDEEDGTESVSVLMEAAQQEYVTITQK